MPGIRLQKRVKSQANGKYSIPAPRNRALLRSSIGVGFAFDLSFMASDLVAVIGALSGVAIGGLINYLASMRVKNHEWRLSLARDRVALLQKLYVEFLGEAQRVVRLAREEKVASLSDFDFLHSKMAEVSLVAGDEVVAQAHKLVDCAVTSRNAPPANEVSKYFELRKSFIAAARAEIQKVLCDA